MGSLAGMFRKQLSWAYVLACLDLKASERWCRGEMGCGGGGMQVKGEEMGGQKG